MRRAATLSPFMVCALLALAGCESLGDGGADENQGGSAACCGTTGPGGGAELAGFEEQSYVDAQAQPVGDLSLCPEAEGPYPASNLIAGPPALRSAASAMYARAALGRGMLPDPLTLRPEDFLSLYGDRKKGSSPEVTVSYFDAEGAVTGRGFVEARVVLPDTPRGPMHLVVVVDTSTSMRDALDLVASSLGKLAAHGTDGDEFSLVFAGPQAVEVFRQLKTDEAGPSFSDAAAQLRTPGVLSGGADLPLALAFAGDLALDSRPTQVVLFTDGGSPVDARLTSALEALRKRVGGRISLIVAGKPGREGPPVFPRAFVQTFEPIARGASVYLGSDEDVTQVFDHRYDELFGTWIEAGRVELTLPGGLQLEDDVGAAGDSTGGVPLGFGRSVPIRRPIVGCGADVFLKNAVAADDSVFTVGFFNGEEVLVDTHEVRVADAVLPTPARLRDDAILEVVRVLREPGAPTLGGRELLGTAREAHACGAQAPVLPTAPSCQKAEDDPCCALAELHGLLDAYDAIEPP
jgi:hypothetical protein